MQSSAISPEGHGADGADHDIVYPAAIPFALLHLSSLAAIWSGVTWRAVAIGVTLYWVRIFSIGAGYHRYFSHRAYSTSRVFQFALAFLSQSSAQSSVLWWAAKHRNHHLYSDTAQDTHSAKRKGFFYSHVGWIFDRPHRETDFVKIADLARYPELMFLHRFEFVPALMLAVGCYLLAGWSGLVVGFVWSTVAVYHGTFSINSLAHMHGRQRYVTGDHSRNNWVLAFFTLGEGWHNNHHACQSSARQGFRWWEIDVTYYVLWTLSHLRIVWDLKAPPLALLRNEQPLGSRVIDRSAEQLALHFNPELIARAIRGALQPPELSVLQETLIRARDRTAEVLAGLHLPELPSREACLACAEAMFARTRSLDEIVDRAYERLLTAVGASLAPRVEQPA